MFSRLGAGPQSMEFYELNRLYDESLGCLEASRMLDRYLYSLMPVFVSLGCGISLINMVVLWRSNLSLASRNFLLAQALFSVLFQLVTAAILISNNYEKELLNSYFADRKPVYLLYKQAVNIVYNVLLYTVVWLFTISCFDFSVLSILKVTSIKNYTKSYYKLFIQQLAHFSYIKRQHELYNQNLLSQYTYKDCFNKADLNPTLLGDELEGELYLSSAHDSNLPYLSLSRQQSKARRGHAGREYLERQTKIDAADMCGLEMYELENSEAVCVNYDNYDKNDRLVFCSSSRIIVTVVFTLIFSFLLALPQIFAYEIKLNSGKFIRPRLPLSIKQLSQS